MRAQESRNQRNGNKTAIKSIKRRAGSLQRRAKLPSSSKEPLVKGKRRQKVGISGVNWDGTADAPALTGSEAAPCTAPSCGWLGETGQLLEKHKLPQLDIKCIISIALQLLRKLNL